MEARRARNDGISHNQKYHMQPIIDMESYLKSAGKLIGNLEAEFLALVVDNVGQGNFKECESSEF